jgi:hypothetical protein
VTEVAHAEALGGQATPDDAHQAEWRKPSGNSSAHRTKRDGASHPVKAVGYLDNRRAETGQQIVDLRTAVRGRIWQAVWKRILTPPSDTLPMIPKQTPRRGRKPREKVRLR